MMEASVGRQHCLRHVGIVEIAQWWLTAGIEFVATIETAVFGRPSRAFAGEALDMLRLTGRTDDG